MEIIDKTKNKKEQWQLGDVLVNNTGNISLIVQTNYRKYCLMNIYPSARRAYSTMENDIFLVSYASLDELYHRCFFNWHKVNAKLVIE